MSDRECRCGRPTRDGAYVCDGCVKELEAAFYEVPWLDDELTITMTKQRGAPTEGSAKSAEKSLPWNEAAAEVRHTMRNILVSWVRLADEENWQGRPDWYPQDTWTSMSRWLLHVTPHVRFNELAGEMVREIVEAVRHCRDIIDRKPDREYAGPCTCGRDLYRLPGEGWVRCRHCGEQTDTEALREQMREAVYGRHVTAREGAGLLCKFDLPTKQGTIDKWRERKLLIDRGHDGKGARLYLFDDLMTLAARHGRKVSA